MAQAVKRLFPAVRVAIGPSIEDGFYYDFAKAEPFSPDDLVKIEAVMREIAKADHPFEPGCDRILPRARRTVQGRDPRGNRRSARVALPPG
jgi:hypothetical protein